MCIRDSSLGIKECNAMYFMWSFFLYTCFVSWIAHPIVSYIIDIFCKSKSYVPGAYNIIMFVTYPFSINQSPVFELILILEFFLTILEIEKFRVHELIFFYVTTMACTQISILSSSLCCSIKCSNEQHNSQNLQATSWLNYQRLTECVQDHPKIIR